jgi:hypothetical protein
LGRLPWFGPVFLRSRRLRARFDMGVSSRMVDQLGRSSVARPARVHGIWWGWLRVVDIRGWIDTGQPGPSRRAADMAAEIKANVLVHQTDPIAVVE